MKKRPIKVLVVDDHMIVRRGLVSLISLNPVFEVVGEAGDGQNAIEQATLKDPDVVLMDINMPVKDGLEATKEILLRQPRVKVLALSGYDHPEYVQKILECGAHGYLLKTTSAEELYAAIDAVFSGNAFFSTRISKILLDKYVQESKQSLKRNSELKVRDLLSEREREILRYIALGKTHQQIGEILHISARTVDTHRNNIIKKTDLHDTASLVTYAIKEGIITIPS
jgi:DNA-binding NarL/FixJ family response regulator